MHGVTLTREPKHATRQGYIVEQVPNHRIGHETDVRVICTPRAPLKVMRCIENYCEGRRNHDSGMFIVEHVQRDVDCVRRCVTNIGPTLDKAFHSACHKHTIETDDPYRRASLMRVPSNPSPETHTVTIVRETPSFSEPFDQHSTVQQSSQRRSPSVSARQLNKNYVLSVTRSPTCTRYSCDSVSPSPYSDQTRSYTSTAVSEPQEKLSRKNPEHAFVSRSATYPQNVSNAPMNPLTNTRHLSQSDSDHRRTRYSAEADVYSNFDNDTAKQTDYRLEDVTTQSQHNPRYSRYSEPHPTGMDCIREYTEAHENDTKKTSNDSHMYRVSRVSKRGSLDSPNESSLTRIVVEEARPHMGRPRVSNTQFAVSDDSEYVGPLVVKEVRNAKSTHPFRDTGDYHVPSGPPSTFPQNHPPDAYSEKPGAQQDKPRSCRDTTYTVVNQVVPHTKPYTTPTTTEASQEPGFVQRSPFYPSAMNNAKGRHPSCVCVVKQDSGSLVRPMKRSVSRNLNHAIENKTSLDHTTYSTVDETADRGAHRYWSKTPTRYSDSHRNTATSTRNTRSGPPGDSAATVWEVIGPIC